MSKDILRNKAYDYMSKSSMLEMLDAYLDYNKLEEIRLTLLTSSKNLSYYEDELKKIIIKYLKVAKMLIVNNEKSILNRKEYLLRKLDLIKLAIFYHVLILKGELNLI